MQNFNIGSDTNFKNSKVTNLGNLGFIGRDTAFRCSKVVGLENLNTIGGDADFIYSKVTDLYILKFICWSVFLAILNYRFMESKNY